MATVLTRNQYENQFVDFYEQTLGTGISVVDPIEDDDTQDDGTTRSGTLAGVGSVGGEDAFNPMAGTNPFTGGPSYTANNIMASDYVRDNAKSARRSMDKSDSGFASYMKNLTTEQFKERPGEVAILGAASIATGFPLTAVGAVAGDLNRKKQYDNAKKIAATGGGNMMNLNGQTVSRVAGSRQYTGTLGNFTSEQIYAIEELGKGFIPGTMEESLANPDDSRDGTFKTTGKQGLLDAATAERLGGNYDAYGNWHSTKYGTVSRGAPIKAAEELAKQLGVYTPNMDLVKFSNTWKDSAKPQTTTQGTFRDFLSGLFSNPLRDSTIDEYKTQLEKTRANIRSYGSGQQEDSDDGPQSDGTKISDSLAQRVEEQGRTDYFDDVYEDSNDSGGGTSFSGSSPSPENIGFGGFDSSTSAGTPFGDFASGGRVGMQAGGTAPAGFVQGPPGQFSEAETVADDQPMEVPEGTFVINAPAVEHAGSQDIRKMIIDAYTVAREKGLDIGRVDRKLYEESIDVALSKGEVVIPPQIAKIIGYDRLRKINNRGKKEVSRRQKASEGGFLGLAEGGVTSPTRKPKKEQLADIEFRADMEIFIQNDPLARLGYKLYEDRNLRFNAFVANPPKYNKDGELIGGTRNTAGGAFYPAQGVRRDKSDDPRRTRPAPESVFAKGVKRQGVKSPIEDSIPHMFLVAGESITQDRFQSYITAAHELRHAALDYLSKKYDFDLEPLPVEEQMMDYADLMAREKAAKLNPNVSKIFKLKDTQYKKESSSSIPEIKRKYDLYSGLAEKMLKKEGYPAQTPAMEPEGFLTRTYKSLVN